MTEQQAQTAFPVEFRTEALASERLLTAVVVPYGETSMMTPYPNGERFVAGAFRQSAAAKSGARRPVLLFRAHDHSQAIGRAEAWRDSDQHLEGDFRIATGLAGDQAIDELQQGLLPSMSVGFRAIRTRRGSDGAREVLEAALLEASLAPMGAYDGAEVLALRTPGDPAETPALLVLPAAPAYDLSVPFRPWRG